MNLFSSLLISTSMLFSSVFTPVLFSISPNPFSNTTIQYTGFSNNEEAISYYYNQVKNNSISYSISDRVSLLSVLAFLMVRTDVSSVDTDLLSNVRSLFNTGNVVIDTINQFGMSLVNFAGYIIRPSEVNSIGGRLLDFLKNRHQWVDDPNMYFFAYLYDEISFERESMDLSIALKTDIDDSLSSGSSNPYTLYSLPDFSLLSSIPSTSFYNSDIYLSYLSDLESFSSSHKYFSILLFNNASARSGVSLYSTSLGYFLSPNDKIRSYLFLAYDTTSTPVRTSSNSYSVNFSYYTNNWTLDDPSNSSISFICKAYDLNSSSVISLDSFQIILATYDNFYSYYHYNSPGSRFIPIANLTNSLSLYTDDFNYYRFYYSYRPLVPSVFSRSNSDFLVFNSLQDFENYTLENSLYFKSTETPTQLTYNTINSYQTVVNNNNNAYNNVNQYVIDNSVQYIDNSTQTVINNYYSFDISVTFNKTINNLRDVNDIEASYWSKFNDTFQSNNIGSFDFNSYDSIDHSSDYAYLSSFVSRFYNNLPNQLKMLLAGVLVVGVFGLLLDVFAKMNK